MCEAALIGVWSEDRRYGPGAQSDQLVVFLPNGQGCLQICNAAMEHVEVFDWTLNQDGTLKISGTARRTTEYNVQEGQTTEEPGRLHFQRLRFRIEREDTPRGDEMDVLTLGDGQNNWSRCLFDVQGLVAEKFGLVRRFQEGFDLEREIGIWF